jgi:anti-sigma regulatory factor (Ser/Thr protein kinase)
MNAPLKQSFEANAAGTRQALDFVETSTRGLGVSAAVGRRVLTAVDEIVSNVVRYAYGGEAGAFGVSVARRDDDVIVEVADRAPAFNPLLRPAPDTTAPLEARDVGGLGIALVRALADDVRYERHDEENRLTMVWRIGS